MADILPVTVGSIVMDNEPDANGVRWRVLRTGMPGWASPVIERNTVRRSSTHGVATASRWYRARDFVIRGRILAPDFDTAWDAYYQLVGEVALGQSFTVLVDEPTPKQLTCELAGDQPDMTEPGGDDDIGWRVQFQLPLSADYPFKTAPDPESAVVVNAGTTGSITGLGTAAAEIEVTLTSPGTVDLTIGGLRLRTAALPSGAVLTSGPGFTNPQRTIRTSGGGNLFGDIIQPMQWPAIAPGPNAPDNAGTANLSIVHYSTFN